MNFLFISVCKVYTKYRETYCILQLHSSQPVKNIILQGYVDKALPPISLIYSYAKSFFDAAKCKTEFMETHNALSVLKNTTNCILRL